MGAALARREHRCGIAIPASDMRAQTASRGHHGACAGVWSAGRDGTSRERTGQVKHSGEGVLSSGSCGELTRTHTRSMQKVNVCCTESARVCGGRRAPVSTFWCSSKNALELCVGGGVEKREAILYTSAHPHTSVLAPARTNAALVQSIRLTHDRGATGGVYDCCLQTLGLLCKRRDPGNNWPSKLARLGLQHTGEIGLRCSHGKLRQSII